MHIFSPIIVNKEATTIWIDNSEMRKTIARGQPVQNPFLVVEIEFLLRWGREGIGKEIAIEFPEEIKDRLSELVNINVIRSILQPFEGGLVKRCIKRSSDSKHLLPLGF